MGAAPFPRGGGTVHLRYDAWNVRVGSLWWAQPGEPNRGGGGLRNRLAPPPQHPQDYKSKTLVYFRSHIESLFTSQKI